MEKYQNLTSNVGIILKKVRLMDKYIHGFQIRKIFPFHLFLGSPDWDEYAQILKSTQTELQTQKKFIQLELKSTSDSDLKAYYLATQNALPTIDLVIKRLLESNELHRDRFFDSKSVSLSQLNEAIKAFHTAQDLYYQQAQAMHPLFLKLLSESEKRH